MDTVFLPGNIRQRLLDLMKHNNVSQTELSRKIGCNDSLLSRFLSEKTDKLGDENIIRIARAFNVSTDFLLGVTTVPDRPTYWSSISTTQLLPDTPRRTSYMPHSAV